MVIIIIWEGRRSGSRLKFGQRSKKRLVRRPELLQRTDRQTRGQTPVTQKRRGTAGGRSVTDQEGKSRPEGEERGGAERAMPACESSRAWQFEGRNVFCSCFGAG